MNHLILKAKACGQTVWIRITDLTEFIQASPESYVFVNADDGSGSPGGLSAVQKSFLSDIEVEQSYQVNCNPDGAGVIRRGQTTTNEKDLG